MEYENDKQVVFLKDLFFSILYRWKGILIAALIGALLLGGFQLLQGSNPGTQTLQDNSLKESQLLQSITLKKAAVTNQTEYLQESSLMNMDPYRLYKANLSFYVQNDYQIQPSVQFQNPDSTPALLNAYLQLLSESTLTKQIAESAGINALYVPELFTAQVSTGSVPGVLSVAITFNDQAKLEKMAELTKNHLLSAVDSVKTQLGNHTVNCTVTSVGLTTDANLATLQKQAVDQLDLLSSELDKLQTQYDTIASDPAYSVATMAIIGGVLGIILMIAYALLKHICSAKAYSARTLANQTDLPVIGSIASPAKCNKFDRLLKKWEGRNITAWDEQIAILAAHISGIGYGDNLCVTGDGDVKLLEKFAADLSKAGVKTSYAASLLRCADGYSALSECSCIILLEQQGTSHYRNVEKEAALIQKHGKPLLGCIFADN